MAIHKLSLNDVLNEVAFTLIGIHCTLEDYRLAYLVNKYLGIALKRKPKNIDTNNGTSTYSIFEWVDKKHLVTWSLVANTCKVEHYETMHFNSLFNEEEKITKTTHLIPEYKRVNYFLKIDTPFDDRQQTYNLKNILAIPQIITAYSIDTDTLRSKDNLIFN